MMTRTGIVASAIVFFALAATSAAAERPEDQVRGLPGASAGGREGNQGPRAAKAAGVMSGARRTLALAKKRKRHGKHPTSSPSDDKGVSKPSEIDQKDSTDKSSDSGESSEETPVPAEPEPKKKVDKAIDEGEGGDKTPVSAEPELKKKKGKSHEAGDAGNETQVSAKAERASEPGRSRPEALDVAVGMRVMARSLSYTQDIYPNNPSRNSRYGLPSAPMTALTADFYPLALFTDGFAANLGLTADVGYLLPVVTTAAPSGTGSYKAESLSWSAGAKVRLPLGLFVTAAYGDQRYQQTPSGGATGIDLPKTDYTFVRGGAGVRYLATSEVALMASAGYLQCLKLGQIGAAPYYPKAKGAAFDAGVAIGYRVSSMFEVRAGVDVRRYGLALHVTAADYTASVTNGTPIRVAGGAVDQYLSGSVALAVILDGKEGKDGKDGRGGGRRHRDDDVPPADGDASPVEQ